MGDAGVEAELSGDGEILTLLLEREYVGKRWVAAPADERSHYNVNGASDPYLFQLGAEAASRLRRQQTLSPHYVESLAHLVTVHVRERYLQRRQPVPDRAPATLAPHTEARVRAHIRTHLGANLLLADLAEVVGVSTSHFAKAFRQSVGETPHRFIVRQRIELAQELLRSGGGTVSLSEAAFRAGFSSQSHFTRCFRSVCGVTPGEFLHKIQPSSTRT